MKNFLKISLIAVALIITSFGTHVDAAGEMPEINCFNLPGCTSTSESSPESDLGNSEKGGIVTETITNVIAVGIQYTMVIAVISLMIAGFVYMTSGGEEEKANKAKKWIIYTGVGVIVTMLAYTIVSIIDNISIRIGGGSSNNGVTINTP